MKKVTFFMLLAVVAGLASCTAQSPNLKTDIDTLSYAFGVAQSEGLEQYLERQGVDSTQMSYFIKGFKEGVAKTDAKELGKDIAYLMGIQIGGQIVSKRWVEDLNHQLFEDDSIQTISKDNLIAGFLDGVKGNEQIFTTNSAAVHVKDQMSVIREQYIAERYADNREAGEQYLAANKEKEGVITTPSGLQYKIITEGTGEIPSEKSNVKVNYRGTLIDGTEFDSSYKRTDKDGNPQPASFRVDNVIKGWTEALLMMPVGSKWEIYVPYELAYGNRHSGSYINPFSALCFEVELVEIVGTNNNK